MALALVLRRDAQDVWSRSDSRQNPDASAWARLGQHRDGSGVEQEAPSVVALHSTRKSKDSCARRLSFLS